MKKLKGPDLKMPELKTPAFLNDLYYDLRDRRLLPLVALVIVAIAAVPFLLGDDPEEPYVPAPGGGLSALGSEKTSKLTVVEATPGLRDYRKRLSDRSPTNPFKQRYTGLPESAQVQSSVSGSSAESSGGAPIVTESSTTETTEVTESGGSGGSATGGGGSEGKSPKLEFVIDVQISHSEKTADGDEKMSPIEVRHDVPILAQLPGKKTSVVTLLGANIQKERLVFLASHAVKSISGEYSCVTRGEICELLEVGEGVLLEYVYEPTGVHYAIKVTNAAVIPARKNRAARSSRSAFMLSHPGLASKSQNFSK
ncbi:MAG TPA: hypothetical protein VK471_02265 [Solirubrobacterales bacterium]|nr:hypothetical protein [Solirubrobacterales bacterium]